MAKKKKANNNNSLKNVLGFSFLQNEKVNFILGLILFATAACMATSFVSFLTTGNIDQSMIESAREGEIMNQNGEFVNSGGSIGAYLSYFFIKQCFGLAAFLIPIYILIVSLNLMRVYNISLLKWFLCMSVIMVWSSITMAKFLSPLFIDSFYNPGGDHGLYVCQWTENLIGTPGITALLAITAIAFLTYISAETIYLIRKMLNPVKFFTDRVKFDVSVGGKHDENENYNDKIKTLEDPEVFDNPETQTVEFAVNSDVHIINNVENDNPKTEKQPLETDGNDKKQIDMEVEAAKDEEKAQSKQLVTVGDKQIEAYDPKLDLENYHYPTLDLLKKYDNDGKPYIDMAEQNANKNRIIEVLRNFGIEISSIKATVGPTITLYEITPAQGVRIAKIRNLEDDIALSLKALGIRIIAPIPGKGTIGIEVPNAKPNIVSMESILNSKKFQESAMELPCAVGKTITNEVFMFDLAKIPHLLVAGATGQGKSVGLNAILTSLLYKKHPAELKIVLIDPKKVEFSIYGPIANHFLAKVPDEDAEPIITDVTKVVRTLNSLCKEMDTRYDLLKAAGARNIK